MWKFKATAFIMFFLLLICCAKKPEIRLKSDSDFEGAFSKANKLIEQGLYEDARDLLNKIRSDDISNKYASLAQLRIADSYVKEGEPELAIEEFRQFLEVYVGHKYAPYAQYQVGLILFNQIEDSERGYGFAAEALKEFETLRLMYPRNPYRDDVEAKIQKSKKIIADHELMVGIFYYKKDAYEGALQRLIGLLERFPDYDKEADVLYYMTMSYRRLGDPEKAEYYLKLLMDKYPESKLIEKAKTQ